MNILVTGATGFLGFHIAKQLKEAGHSVFNFSRSHTSELDEIKVESRLGDLSDKSAVEEALIDIEAVFHVAGKVGMWGKWQDFAKANIEGTKNLVQVMKERNIKYLVYTSTPSVVFGKDPIINGDENLSYPSEYLSLYAKSKAIAEDFVLKSVDKDFYATSLRPHLIYGERDKNIIPRLIEANKKKKLKAIGDRENLVDIIYVENAANAHIRALEELMGSAKNNSKPYFIGQERPVNLWSFIDDILKIKGQSPVKSKISLKKAYLVGTVIELFLKLFKIFNVHPPMTRFVALQLGTSHFFSHKNAKNDFGYEVKVTIDESIQRLKV